MRRPCRQSSSILDHSRSSAGVTSFRRTRNPQFMVQTFRMFEKPECISAEAERAHALARGAEGQASAFSSAMYSMIASESQTTKSSCTRHGTRPDGENDLKPPGWAIDPNGTSRSSNGICSSLSKSQGRSDHDE